jgi:hypothetical protein
MYHVYRPLEAILNPPDLLSGMPGERLSLSVVVQNKGTQSAVIDVYLDDTDQIPSQWCPSPRQRLALDPQQSGELVFEFTVPIAELPGAYDYSVVIDAPAHYPEDTPFSYPQLLRVLLQEQTQVRVNDPSFFLNPATNTQRPAKLQPGQRLPFLVRVDNRSDRVDKFRLTCLDLDEDWFTIRYRGNQLESAGLLLETPSLDLNPHTQGEIQLELHPPADTLAGIYSPTLRLHSNNLPELVLLDLIYVEVQRVETLNIDLEAIVSRVSHSPGQYRLRLVNPGNVIRQLSFSANGRDEEEWCEYVYDPDQVRLPPNREAQVMLYVTPTRKWRRPLLGGGQMITFQTVLQDAQGYKLPERSPQGTLTWQARPWWQFLLLLLTVLGVLGSIGFLIWFLLRPSAPPEITRLQAVGTYIEDGSSIRLQGRIRNFKQVKKVELTAQGAKPVEPISLDFQTGIPSECQEQKEELLCTFSTNANAAGVYKFTLAASSLSGVSVLPGTVDVEVRAKPNPRVVELKPQASSYKAGDAVKLSWRIDEVSQLQTLSIIAKDKAGNVSPPILIMQDKKLVEDFQSACDLQIKTLICTEVALPDLKSGQYTFSLQSTNTKGETLAEFASPTTVTITAEPVDLVASLNGQTQQIVNVKVGEPLEVTWQVTGGEGNLKVVVNNESFDQRSGNQSLGIASPGMKNFAVNITVTDEAKPTPSQDSIGFSVNVIEPSPSPSPSPVLSPAPPPISERTPAPEFPGGI